MDIVFLPDTKFGYPMPKIRPDLDLGGSDFCCNCHCWSPHLCCEWQTPHLLISV